MSPMELERTAALWRPLPQGAPDLSAHPACTYASSRAFPSCHLHPFGVPVCSLAARQCPLHPAASWHPSLPAGRAACCSGGGSASTLARAPPGSSGARTTTFALPGRAETARQQGRKLAERCASAPLWLAAGATAVSRSPSAPLPSASFPTPYHLSTLLSRRQTDSLGFRRLPSCPAASPAWPPSPVCLAPPTRPSA